MKLGILASHPIQYQAPLFRCLAQQIDLHVFFAHRQSAQAQAAAGFGVAFDWDVDLLSGYRHYFLRNTARRPDSSRFFGCDTPEIRRLIRAGGFDAFLVMGWHLKCFWQAVWACREAGVPIMARGDSQLATSRSGAKRALKAVLYPAMIRQFDALLYVGQRNKAYLEHYGARADRLFLAPHCVDNDRFAKAARAADRDATRATWRVGAHEHAVLFVGKLLARKRAADVLHAVALLRAASKPAIAVLVGDGPESGTLQRVAKDRGVPLRCLGFQNQTELPAVYAAADVLALPSSASETWGLVVNEALACGTPCVVSDVCGCMPDMVVPAVTGDVFPVGNVPALAAAIERALAIPRGSPALLAHIERHGASAAAKGIAHAARQIHTRKRT